MVPEVPTGIPGFGTETHGSPSSDFERYHTLLPPIIQFFLLSNSVSGGGGPRKGQCF